MYIQAYRKRVIINGYVFSVQVVQVTTMANDLSIKNSEGRKGSNNGGFGPPNLAQSNFVTRLSGNAEATVRIKQASFDPTYSAADPLETRNPFNPPFSIAEGQYASMEVLMEKTNRNVRWLFPSLLILEVDDMSNVIGGLQPISFVAKTDGGYDLPVSPDNTR